MNSVIKPINGAAFHLLLLNWIAFKITTKTNDAILAIEISFNTSISVMFRPITINSKAEAMNIDANSLLVCENGSKSSSLTGFVSPGCGLGDMRTIIPIIKKA